MLTGSSSPSASMYRISTSYKCVVRFAPLTTQEYRARLLRENILPVDIVQSIFANLNQLVDFQRRFLIGVEAHAEQSGDAQRFGHLFMSMARRTPVTPSDGRRRTRSRSTSLTVPTSPGRTIWCNRRTPS